MKLPGLIFLILAFTWNLHAQNERKLNREGVSLYQDEKFNDAELSFRKAREADTTLSEAAYNIANTLYKQDKFDEATNLFEKLISNSGNELPPADLFHNLGNSFLKKKEYQKSVEAYKNSLRLRPDYEDTRYNLAYAQAMLEKNEQEQNEQQQNEQQQNEQEQNEQEQNEQQQEQEQNEQQQQQQEQQKQQQEQQQQQQNQAQAMKSLSKEDMERLLQAIQQQEKKVQAKLEKDKAKAAKVKADKDW